MSDKLVDNVTEEDVSPLGSRIIALFTWLQDTLKGDTEEADKLIPLIFDVSKEEVFDELEKLVENGFLSLGKPN